MIDAVHSDQIREHGGLAGIRGENVLESALARARNKWADENESNLAVLPPPMGMESRQVTHFATATNESPFLPW